MKFAQVEKAHSIPDAATLEGTIDNELVYTAHPKEKR